ncbi:hypothetical protein [Streptomyces tendae]|uniref:hypothetical protein n=1 Tax=Streptomyces tendae TaxID=1932 RepID=UPI0036661A6E
MSTDRPGGALQGELREKWNQARMAITLLPSVIPARRTEKLRKLAKVVEACTFTSPPQDLLMTVGASLSLILTQDAGFYFDVVFTDLTTEECLYEIDQAFEARGLARWREAVVELVSASRPHPNFPGSSRITYLIVHPEALA